MFHVIAENSVYKWRFRRMGPRLTDGERRGLAIKAKAVGRKELARIATIATPDTILRWYRRLVAQKYDGSAKRRPGRPRVLTDARELIVRVATENPRWRYTRIQGAPKQLDLFAGRSTIARVLEKHGLEPAPGRSRRMPWRTFSRAHWGAIAATDFFSVEVLTLRGLVRYFVLFVIDLKTRRVHIAGIVHQPHDAWMKQVARNLTDAVDGFLRERRWLIHDRDPLFSSGFRMRGRYARRRPDRRIGRLVRASPPGNAPGSIKSSTTSQREALRRSLSDVVGCASVLGFCCGAYRYRLRSAKLQVRQLRE